MDEVIERVYIGPQPGSEELKKYGITHILSTGGSQPPKELESLFVDVQDTEDEDIVKYFNETNEFITCALKKNSNNKILVHCVSGVSRSAAFVSAYLMFVNKWTPNQALEYTKQKHPQSAPNPGFLTQLDIYYQHGYDVTDNSKLYREFKLKNHNYGSNGFIYTKNEMPAFKLSWRNIVPFLTKSNPKNIVKVVVSGETWSVTEFVEQIEYSSVVLVDAEENETNVDLDLLDEVLKKAVQRVYAYRCKFCSATLATTSSTVNHTVGNQMRCQHYFVEPIEWMRPELERGDIEGRLSCHKCTKKVGNYSWKGSKCSCGEWVTPAFKLSMDKVDKMLKK